MIIYSIESDGLIWYIGEALDTIRKSYDTTDKSEFRPPTEYAWSYKVLEKCLVRHKKERLRYWIGKLKPLYTQMPIVRQNRNIENYNSYQRVYQRNYRKT